MKIDLEVSVVGVVETFSRMHDALPSLSEEIRAEKLKELGEEPLCKENFAEYLFLRGFRAFEDEELSGNKDKVASAIYKAETANIITELTQKIVHVHVVHQAKLTAIEKEFGKDSEEYKKQSQFLAGIDYLFSVYDSEVTGKDEIRKALKASLGEVPIEMPPAEKPKPKTKKSPAKSPKKATRKKR